MLPQILEIFSKIDFNLFRIKSDISFIKKFIGKRIIFVGYNEKMNFDVMPDINLDNIDKIIDNYDLFVLNNKLCYLSISEIKEILSYFKNKKKDVIFSGYTTIINANIDNSKNMFRPIDITKYPFAPYKFKVLQMKWNVYFTLIFIVCLSLLIFGSLTTTKILYKIMCVFLIFLGFVLPVNKIIYIHNNI